MSQSPETLLYTLMVASLVKEAKLPGMDIDEALSGAGEGALMGAVPAALGAGLLGIHIPLLAPMALGAALGGGVGGSELQGLVSRGLSGALSRMGGAARDVIGNMLDATVKTPLNTAAFGIKHLITGPSWWERLLRSPEAGNILGTAAGRAVSELKGQPQFSVG